VKRLSEFEKFYGETSCLQELPAVVLIKHVMMQTTVFKVLQRSLTEMIIGTRERIARQVVLRQNLLEMSLVSLVGSELVILKHVCDWSRAAQMVKCMTIIWKNNDD
jgi:hypothetical protein